MESKIVYVVDQFSFEADHKRPNASSSVVGVFESADCAYRCAALNLSKELRVGDYSEDYLEEYGEKIMQQIDHYLRRKASSFTWKERLEKIRGVANKYIFGDAEFGEVPSHVDYRVTERELNKFYGEFQGYPKLEAEQHEGEEEDEEEVDFLKDVPTASEYY